jgi:outer membrane protein
VRAAQGERRAAEGDVRLEAMRAYWTLATARETARVLERSLARTDAYVADVQARLDAGFLPPNDLQSAKAARARQQVFLFQARNAASLAELDLARLIGEPPGTAIVTATLAGVPMPKAATLAAMTPAELVQMAIANRGERAALAARGDGLRHSAEATLANLKPYIIGTGWVEPAKPNYRFVPPVNEWRTAWTIDFKLTWPIFDGGRSKAQAASIRYQAAGVDARRTDVENLIGLEVRQQLLDMQYYQAAITAAEEGVAAATEALRVVDERFRAGVATSTEVLDAQLAVIENELDRTRLQAGLRLAEARLLRAVGGQP